MLTDFHAVMIEGIFYLEDGTLKCRRDHGEVVSVFEIIQPLRDQVVHFSMHYVPPMPPQVNAPGFGSCLVSGGHCRVGHHVDPHKMLQVRGQGTLTLDGELWNVRQVDGTTLNHSDFLALEGHHARMLMASALTVDQMRDTVLNAGHGDSVEDLVRRASNLTELLGKLTNMTSEPRN